MAEVEIFKLFLLVMIRVGGLVVSAPVLGSRNFPIMGKMGLTALTAMLITPTLPALAQALPSEPMNFGLLAIGELMIGLMMGFVMTLVFAAIQVAGQIMDLQTGFGMMNIFNPAMETQYPIFGFFLFVLGVLFLLTTGGHRMMLWALYSTYEHLPVGGFTARPELWMEVGRWGRWLFIDGLMIAAPVTAAMLLAYAVMGLLGRVVPQIQLFVVGFPITIATGLFLMALIIGIYLYTLEGMFNAMFKNVETLVRGMS